MRMYQDERQLDFHALGREIKRKREAKGWTQEYLAQLVDRTPRSICLMLRKKLFTVFAGLVLFKGRPCLGILHRCRLQFHVGMEGRFGAFDLVRQLVKIALLPPWPSAPTAHSPSGRCPASKQCSRYNHT